MSENQYLLTNERAINFFNRHSHLDFNEMAFGQQFGSYGAADMAKLFYYGASRM